MSDTKMQRWGNSMALRVPATLVRAWGVEEGQSVTLSVEGDALVAKPARKRLRLADLIAQCDFAQPMSTEEREWLDVPPVGLEQI